MTLFEYFCNDDRHHEGCGYEFEEYLSQEDRMQPMDAPCPSCGKKDNVCRKFNINLHRGVVNPGAKMDDNFKETMKRISVEHGTQSTYF
jgi:hypothetical protein